MKPTQDQIDFWYTVEDLMPFNSSGVRKLVPCDIDAIPEVDDKGRLNIDGWSITWEGEVQPDWANLNNTLHGAAAAWMVDVCTSAAIMVHTSSSFWGPPMPAGVSLAINMTYFHPAPVGTDILVKVTIQKCSLTSANLTCDITDKRTGKLYASGTHIKAWRGPREAKL